MGIAQENKYINGSGSFPNWQGIDASGIGTTDGSEFVALNINDGYEQWQQSVMDYAAGNQNSPSGSVGVPNGIADSAGASQLLQAIQKAHGIGPGTLRGWSLASAPSVTGDRVLLLSGQGVLRTTYPALDAAVYVGDGNNATAPYFYHADDSGGVTRNTTGAYLILPDQNDFPGIKKTTYAFWNTVNGYGSTNNKIRKFTTEIVASDDIVVTVVNDATNGFSITANFDCELFVSYTDTLSLVQAKFGLSLNSSQLTTTILSITAADRLAVGSIPDAGNNLTSLAWSGKISAGDIVRPHGDGVTDGSTPSWGCIHVLAIAKIDTDYIGIVY